ncbi:cytochrome b [Chthonobacter albigriseus]|uniref:cytochrome b n=1 Tax=Chthonobacter albigriseus TaxID=1683161 RepID=UPI0015EF1FD2|nr:cytochrome b/b6 domain-containing protein [Chthonobacter albigriseus]
MVAPSLLPTVDRYRPTARLLHWAVAALVLGVWPVGFVIKFVKDDFKNGFYFLHEGFGFLVLWLMLARLLFRLVWPPPPEVPMPAIFARTAAVVHALLYVALIAQPLLGFLMTNAFGFPFHWFGLVEVWSPVGKDEALGAVLKQAHIVVGYSILVLFALHLGGVLFHHVLRRDATLYRML